MLTITQHVQPVDGNAGWDELGSLETDDTLPVPAGEVLLEASCKAPKIEARFVNS